MSEKNPDRDKSEPPVPAPTAPKGSTATAVKEKTRPDQRKQTKKLPPYNVVLLDDDDHSYEYVITMLADLFAYPPEKGFQLAEEVDSTGRVIVMTTHKEKAELKRDQILGYGADPRDSN